MKKHPIPLVDPAFAFLLLVAVCFFAGSGCSSPSSDGIGGQAGESAGEKSQVTSTKPAPPSSEDSRFRESRFMRAEDMFIATDEPPHVSAEAAEFLLGSDEVLGFVVEGKPRAYSVAALSYHHVVNDMIGETPIAVTY